MTARKKKEEQPNLFGRVDEVYNALETERTYITDEIKDCFKAIDRKKAVIRILEERKHKLDRALKITSRQRNEIKPDEPEPKPRPKPKVEVKVDAKKPPAKPKPKVEKSAPKPKAKPKVKPKA